MLLRWLDLNRSGSSGDKSSTSEPVGFAADSISGSASAPLFDMWNFITLIFNRLIDSTDGKLATIQTQLEKLMKASEQIIADLAVVNANLEETKGDLAEVIALNATQVENIAALEASIADLKTQVTAQVGEIAALDTIAAQVAAIKDTSRAIADVVPEPPAVEPPAPDTPPAV
jgi:septal ring factor EnvC (AmiA/AmiB activator)